MPGPGVFPGMGGGRRFPGRRGRRPLRGWLPVDVVAARTCGGVWAPRPTDVIHVSAVGCRHLLMGRSVGRGLDPSAGVCGRQGACPPPRGRGRACPARRFSRGWVVTGGFRGGGVRAPRPTDVIHVSAVGAAYMPPASLCGMPFSGCFFFQHWAGHTVENVSSLPGMDV